jgi:hypothetical protein
MPTKRSIKETKEYKIQIQDKRTSRKKEVVFGDLIDELNSGESIEILNKEWKLKTPIPGYYYSKYNKSGERVVSCRKTKNGYLVERI